MESVFAARNKAAALIAYRAFSDVAGKGALLLVTILAARRLSQESFGIFSLGSTVGWMVAVATDLGIQVHLARAVARRPDNARRLLEVWLRVRLRTAAIGLAVVGFVIAFARPGRGYTIAILLLVLAYVVGGLVEFVHYFYRGLSRSDLESTFTLCGRAAMLACAAAGLAWRQNVTTLALALVLPALATLVISVRRAQALAGTTHEGGDEHDRPRSVWEDMRRDVLPIGTGIMLSALYFRVDVLLIQFWNGPAHVGLYNAVFRLVEALRLFPAAVLAVALPSLCRATTVRPVLQVSAGATGFAIAVVVVLWSGAGWLVSLLYGRQYAAAVPAFRVLLLSYPLMSLNYVLTQQLIGWHGHRAFAAICAAALVFNVVLNAQLIPSLSIVGAAWTTLWTEVLLTLACAAALWVGRGGQRAGAFTVTVA